MSPPPTSIDGTGISGVTIDGQEVQKITIDGNTVFGGIPDSDVYLHDDFEDNKLTNRDGSGTTTYNGVQGIFRPEWTLDTGTETVSNGQLIGNDGDHFRADINLNLNFDINWILDFTIPENGVNDSTNFTLYSESTTEVSGFSNGYAEGYVFVTDTSSNTRLVKLGSSGNATRLLEGLPNPNQGDVLVTRTSTGDWSVTIDGTTFGPVNDTEYTNPEYLGFSKRENEVGDIATVESIKVN